MRKKSEVGKIGVYRHDGHGCGSIRTKVVSDARFDLGATPLGYDLGVWCDNCLKIFGVYLEDEIDETQRTM